MFSISGTVQLPEASFIKKSESSSSILDSTKQMVDLPHAPASTTFIATETSTELLSEELGALQVDPTASDQGWMNWAMSYVPAILIEDDEDIINMEANEQSAPVRIEMYTGFYFDEFNISFKVLVVISV